MSSGYFPLGPGDDDHDTLAAIADDLARIYREYRESSCDLGVPEDAMSDGRYLSDLGSAESLIRGCLKSRAIACPECGGTGIKEARDGS